MKRILFVDDEPHLLEALQRMLRHTRQEWDTEFVLDARQALERLAACPFDVVVSDMRMPGMDGAELLEQVRRRFPATVRIVLSGDCDREAVMRTVKVAHQFLAKPCDSQDIKTTVMRACRLAGRLSDPWHRELVSRVTSVPSPLSTHVPLVAELEAAGPSVNRVGEIVARDVGATAKLLQLVSSSFFGSPRASFNPAHWAGWLGIDTVKLLVLREGAIRAAKAGGAASSFLETLTAHSLQVAQFARLLMESEAGGSTQADHAYLAGLLHDIGLFILAEHLPERVTQVLTSSRSEKTSAWEIERAAFAVTHADLGGYLLALWGAPDVVVDTAVLHHTPALCSETAFGVLTAVHVANALADAADLGLAEHGHDHDHGYIVPDMVPDVVPAAPFVDMEYLGRIGCAGQLPRWCALCRAAKPEEVLS